MTMDGTYNGHANRPTWTVDLWLSSDEGLYREATARVAEVLDMEHPTSPYWAVEESRRFNVADTLKEWVEELADPGEASFRADLLDWALAWVDWNEIAAELDARCDYAEFG